MFGEIVGYAVIVDRPDPEKANHPFGKVADLAGRRLPVLERNQQGDCLVIVDNAIADVYACNIAHYQAR